MIEKLRIHSSEEIKEKLSRTVFGDLLETKYISSQPPTNEELMAKINEIIDFINSEEEELMNETEAFEGVNEVPFDIDWEEKKVWTRCGDPYYDYTISFGSIKKLYELIVSKDVDKN